MCSLLWHCSRAAATACMAWVFTWCTALRSDTLLRCMSSCVSVAMLDGNFKERGRSLHSCPSSPRAALCGWTTLAASKYSPGPSNPPRKCILLAPYTNFSRLFVCLHIPLALGGGRGLQAASRKRCSHERTAAQCARCQTPLSAEFKPRSSYDYAA
jgi:hypothetical protein